MECSVILHDGSTKSLSISDLLNLKTLDSLSLFGASIKDCKDLQALGETLAARSEKYKLWSENLSRASEMLIKEGISRKRMHLLSELSVVSGKSIGELSRLIGE